MILTARRARLLAALGFLQIAWRDMKPHVAGALEQWLHSWAGVGAVVTGMSAQGFNVELKQLPGAWRATFYPTGGAHSIIYGTAYEPTPWRAVQRAAWQAINDPRAAAGGELDLRCQCSYRPQAWIAAASC